MSRNLTQNRAITLMELMVAIILLSMIVLYFSALEQIGRRTTILAERKAQVQNDASYVMEHMRQQILKTIGYKNMDISGTNINPIFIEDKGGGRRKVIRFWVDHDQDGRFNGDNTAHDWILCYALRNGNNEVTFDSHANTYNANRPCAGEVLSKRISDLSIVEPPAGIIQRAPFNLTSNYITLTVTACWDPSAGTCGNEKADNPQVTMQTTIAMPGVSLN